MFRELADQNRNEDDVIDSQDNFEPCEGGQCNPDPRVCYPTHLCLYLFIISNLRGKVAPMIRVIRGDLHL